LWQFSEFVRKIIYLQVVVGVVVVVVVVAVVVVDLVGWCG